jgi:hypothetical protein
VFFYSDVTEFYVTWKVLPVTNGSAPCPREMHSSAVLTGGEGILIAGGRTVDTVLSDVWLLAGANHNLPASSSSISDENDDLSLANKETEVSLSEDVDPATLISVLTTPADSSATDTSIDVGKVQPEVSNSKSSDGLPSQKHPIAWTRVHDLELPHPRCAHTAVVSSGDLILFGGFTGQGISEDLIIARDVASIISNSSPEVNVKSSEKELLSQPISAHWVCLETSRAIDGRFAHSMATISLSLAKKEETDKSGILIFGGINATQDFNDVWLLSAIKQKE